MKDKNKQIEALRAALALAITAPTDEKAAQATAIAEQLTIGLTEAEVRAVQAEFEGGEG